MNATFSLCIELEIRKILRWKNKKAKAPNSKSKVSMFDIRIEIKSFDV